MNRHTAVAAVAAALTLSACAFEPESAEPLAAPPAYRAVWDSAMACTGRRGNFAELRFYVVPGASIDSPEGDAAGWTNGKNVYVAEAYVANLYVIKHEMIHALGVHGHPAVPFVTPCHAR